MNRWKTISRLLFLPLLSLACALGPGDLSAGAPMRAAVAWVDQPPDGCHVGSSGPTLDPRDAVRGARAAAIDGLAQSTLQVEVQSISEEGDAGDFALSSQTLSGESRDVGVVALWAETRLGERGSPRVRSVHALACPLATGPPASVPLPYPDWLVGPRSDSATVCSVGLAGPTARASQQSASALRDAQKTLALALASRIEKRVWDDGRGVARVVRQIDPTEAAWARARRVSALEASWLDVYGAGPLGLPGVLYGLACLEAPDAAASSSNRGAMR